MDGRQRMKEAADRGHMTVALQVAAREEEYYRNPARCKQCSEPLPYKNKRTHKFCNHSCSAIFNNTGKTRRVVIPCLNCGADTTKPNSKFCSRQCTAIFKSMIGYDDWLAGENTTAGPRVLKKWIIRRDSYKCVDCGVLEWNGRKLVLDLEHRDGHSDNNRPDNMCLLCPNCHSQTPTFKGKNKGNGRHARRKRYADGKSY